MRAKMLKTVFQLSDECTDFAVKLAHKYANREGVGLPPLCILRASQLSIPLDLCVWTDPDPHNGRYKNDGCIVRVKREGDFWYWFNDYSNHPTQYGMGIFQSTTKWTTNFSYAW